MATLRTTDSAFFFEPITLAPPKNVLGAINSIAKWNCTSYLHRVHKSDPYGKPTTAEGWDAIFDDSF